MKIKTKKVSYDYVLTLPTPKHKRPKKPSFLFRTLLRLFSGAELKMTQFTYTSSRMEEIGKSPCLILMNHSSFIDLKIAAKLLYPRPYFTVSTTDAFVGKAWLMRHVGCIPTQKFVSDPRLISDMHYAIREKKSSVLMYPEAGYSFDGTPTTLPRKLGVLFKKLDVPVVTIITHGAFLHDPLYNGLRQRKTPVSAQISCLCTREEVRTKSVDELDDLLDKAFTFDNFAEQKHTDTRVTEPFRAEGLNRILYRCASCQVEGEMEGHDTTLTCRRCGKSYELQEDGSLLATTGKTEFSHIPDWYRWERSCVRDELIAKTYRIDCDVEIGVLADYKALYMVGEGHLTHTIDGFTLIGCEGKLLYHQSPLSSHCLNADYYWYEIGDVICIGNRHRLYYCFPKQKDVVSKARLATEELFLLRRASMRGAKTDK